MKNWVTSDWHLGHVNIKKFCKTRPDNFEEVILNNYTAVVKDEDRVFFLGDMVWHQRWWPIFRALPGKKILVRGNHDKGSHARLARLGGFLTVEEPFLKFGDILMSHVPMGHPDKDARFAEWRQATMDEFNRGGYRVNYHGHTHEYVIPDTRYVNCCVEVNDFGPQEIR